MNTKQNLKNRSVSLKTVLGTNKVEKAKTVALLVLMILLTTSLVVAPATINVYLDDLPSQATYTIKTDGTNVWSVRYDGYKAYESTDDQWVIQSTFDVAGPNGGSVYITKGTYYLDSTLYLNGATHKGLTITGDGWERLSSYASIPKGTVLYNNNAGQDVLYMNNSCSAKIEHICFHKGTATGNGIKAYSANALDYVIEGSYFNDLYFIGITTGYFGFYMEGGMYFKVGSMTFDVYGNGIMYKEDRAINTGNSNFDFIFIRLWGNNSVGFAGFGTGNPTNYFEVSYFDLWGGSQILNRTGIYLKNVWHSTWLYCGIESVTNCIIIDTDSKLNNFLGGYLNANDKFIWTKAGSQQNNLENFWVTGSASLGTVITDASEYYNVYRDIKATLNPLYSSLGTFHENTRLYGRIGNKFAQMEGTATIAAGTNSSVAVNSIRMPRSPYVWVTGNDAQVTNLYVTSINATYFVINNFGVTTSSRTVYWYADCNYGLHDVDK